MTWQPWGSWNGSLSGDPSFGETTAGVWHDAYGHYSDNTLRFIETPWPTWASLGGAITGDITTATNKDGRVEIFAVGSNGQTVYHIWETAVVTGNTTPPWSSLVSLGIP